jgi:hypothetical protein
MKIEASHCPVEFAIEQMEEKRKELATEIARIKAIDEKLKQLIVDLPSLGINDSE